MVEETKKGKRTAYFGSKKVLTHSETKRRMEIKFNSIRKIAA